MALGTGRRWTSTRWTGIRWRPALLVGDTGLLMRYVGDTHADNANGSNLLTGRTIDVAVATRRRRGSSPQRTEASGASLKGPAQSCRTVLRPRTSSISNAIARQRAS